MTNLQLYLVIGVPTIAVLIGMFFNGLLFNALSARMSSLEARMTSLETRIDARILAIETSVNQRIDLLIGRVHELDTRLSVIEDRLIRP